MSGPLHWPRPQWQPRPGEEALVLYFVFGAFPVELRLLVADGNSHGLPEGIKLYRQPHEALRQWDGYPFAGALGEILREDDPTAAQRAEAAPEVLTLRGSVADPDSLDYLTGTVSAVCNLLDQGGVAVVDPQVLGIFAADGWLARFGPGELPSVRKHVLILANPDEEGGQRIHSRGMRKFARPDIAIRRVPPAAAQTAGALCQRLVEMQAAGLWFEDGQPLEIPGLDGRLEVRHDPDRNNPQFNNSHIELVWPTAG